MCGKCMEDMVSEAEARDKQIEQLTYERDRARMMADSSGRLAEHRMYKIFDLEKQIEALQNRLDQWELPPWSNGRTVAS